MRDPDLHDTTRRGWRVAHGQTSHTGGLGMWLVRCPGLHAFWEYWLISMVALRDYEGVPRAVKEFPEAEYELMICAVNPEHAPDPDEPRSIRIMSPPDVAEQFQLPRFADDVARPEPDELAKLTLDELVRMVVMKHLHPDSDFRRMWEPAIPYAVGAAHANWLRARTAGT